MPGIEPAPDALGGPEQEGKFFDRKGRWEYFLTDRRFPRASRRDMSPTAVHSSGPVSVIRAAPPGTGFCTGGGGAPRFWAVREKSTDRRTVSFRKKRSSSLASFSSKKTTSFGILVFLIVATVPSPLKSRKIPNPPLFLAEGVSPGTAPGPRNRQGCRFQVQLSRTTICTGGPSEHR